MTFADRVEAAEWFLEMIDGYLQDTINVLEVPGIEATAHNVIARRNTPPPRLREGAQTCVARANSCSRQRWSGSAYRTTL
jgi:hypothetical protein